MASASMLFFFSWFLLAVISHWFISMFHLKEMSRPRSRTEWLSGNYQGNSFGVQKIQTYDIRRSGDCHILTGPLHMPRAWEMLSLDSGPERKIWGERNSWFGIYLLWAIYFNPSFKFMAGNAVCGQGTGEFLKVISEGWLLESLKMGIKEGPLNKPSARNGFITTLLLHTVDYTKAWRLISATATISLAIVALDE